MDLTPTRTAVDLSDDKRWKGSEHAFDCTESITLDVAGGSFAAVTTDGMIASGIPVIRQANGLYKRVTDGVNEVADGHLAESVKTRGGPTAAGALLWHGSVIQAQVPGGMTNANRARHVRYR